MRRILRCSLAIVALTAYSITPAIAQSDTGSRRVCDDGPSATQLFTGALRGFRNLPSRDSAGVVALGGLAAIGARAVDHNLTHEFADEAALGGRFKSGALIGGTPFELGAAFATYGIGRALHHRCAARLGGDLIQAQVMAEALTFGLKEATRRMRPDGTGYSFPSGHAMTAFASATVLQEYFGWKVGIPAYAVASYVAASRVQMKRHYLSDVAFGAALGIAAGRTISMGTRRQFVLAPLVTSDGAGAAITWDGRK